MDLSQQKRQLRQSMSERLARLSMPERQAESRSICRRLLDTLPPDNIVLCAYYPMPTEADLLALYEVLLVRGCTIALPRTEGKSFTFRIIESLESLEKGPFGIKEPTEDTEQIDLKDVQYVLVPGVAFDRTGMRLGRGNGGYDKWIATLRGENDKAECWGVAFDDQVVNAIPTEPHDQALNAIVTPRGVDMM